MRTICNKACYRPWRGFSLAAAGALAIGLMATTAAAQDVKIGAALPLTGALNEYGQNNLLGVKLAASQVNAQGGILDGRTLGIVAGDTQTNPQAGVDSARRLVSVENVVGMVGALSSGVSIPIATSVAAISGVPQISPASTAPTITTLDDNDFMFRTTPHDALQGVVLGNVVYDKGYRKVATIFVNNDYGQGLAEAFQAQFEKRGGQVTTSLAYEEKQASYRGDLSKAATADPEGLVLIAYPGDGIPILKQSLEGGYFDKFIFTDGMASDDMVKQIGGKFLEDSVGTVPQAVPDNPATSLFNKAFAAEYGDVAVKPFTANGYDAAFILALAVEKAGSAEGAKVRDQLRAVAGPPGEVILPGEWAKAKKLIAEGKDINYEGAAGSQDFDAAGDVPGTYGVWTVEGEKIKTLEIVSP